MNFLITKRFGFYYEPSEIEIMPPGRIQTTGITKFKLCVHASVMKYNRVKLCRISMIAIIADLSVTKFLSIHSKSISFALRCVLSWLYPRTLRVGILYLKSLHLATLVHTMNMNLSTNSVLAWLLKIYCAAKATQQLPTSERNFCRTRASDREK